MLLNAHYFDDVCVSIYPGLMNISVLRDDIYESRRYMGYSIPEALAMFCEELHLTLYLTEKEKNVLALLSEDED